MNNKKSEIVTHVADLVKSNKNKVTTATNVVDLVKPSKKDKVVKNLADLIKSDKKDKVVTNVAMTNLIKPTKKYSYRCHCIRCGGIEVDSRTQEKHTEEESFWKSKESRERQESAIAVRKQNKSTSAEMVMIIPKKRKVNHYETSQNLNSNPDPFQLNDDTDFFQLNDDLFPSKFSSCFRALIDENNDDDDVALIDKNNDVDNVAPADKNNDDDNYDMDLDSELEEENNFFASPKFDNEEFMMESLNDSTATEIVIWLFKFQQRFRCADVALESLIKFLRIILLHFDKFQFKDFPTSLFLAKKMLNIFQPKMQLAVCTKCHKLHSAKDVIAYKKEGKVAVMNCSHKEFPNIPTSSRNPQCNNPLSTLKRNKGGTIVAPRALYPKPSVRQQLNMLYQRPDFESMLKSAGGQREGNDIYSDIYDGKVWKTFPFNGNIFFTEETATTHLGLLINLDWFQPFTYTQHSTGAIYASICNLPRLERNKPKNIIYLGFLPGPKEVGLECINHYLAPIVDEFLELWNGWRIPKTYECPDGLDIKAALIVGSSDTPATRKLFGHGGAAMKCYKCEKRSIYSHEYKKTHYGGMEEYDEWMTRPADPLLHRQYAQEWIQCSSKSTRDNHFKEHGVR
jgi:Transposase family tnp2